MRERDVVADGRPGASGDEFLVYWLPTEVDEFIAKGLSLESAVSAQFDRIGAGSRLWIVTCRDGRLHLAGPIRVSEILTRRQALARRNFDIPAGRLCAVSASGREARCANLEISGLAANLRFQSKTAPRLKVERGRVSPQQLQTIRKLTPESAALIERRWREDESSGPRDVAFDRSDPDVARPVVEGLVDPKEARRAFYDLLGRAIRAAHGTSPDCWSITLFKDAVRLNVGQIEVIHLTSNGLRLVVDAGVLSAEARGHLGRHVTDHPRLYRSVPVRKAQCLIPANRIAGLTRFSTEALDALIREAGRLKTRSPFHASYSEGVVRLVETEIRQELPRPGSGRTEATTSSAIHITIAASEERVKLEKASRRHSEVTWTLPLKARTGDLVLFHLTGTGLMAKGRVSVPPRADGKGKRGFGNKSFGDIGSIAILEQPIPIDALQKALPDFGWLRYPRSLTTVPQEIGPRLLALVNARSSVEAEDRDAVIGKQASRRTGQGFGTPEENRVVEEAAVAFVVREYQASGWRVTSRESERVGYDLECARGRDRLHLEVKGLSGEEWTFMATVGELRKAEEDPDFRLVAVRRANSSKPEMRQWTGAQLRSSFEREPVTYRLRLVGR